MLGVYFLALLCSFIVLLAVCCLVLGEDPDGNTRMVSTEKGLSFGGGLDVVIGG